MKILVTGATGFIGSNLVKKLIVNNVNVSIISRPNSDLSVINDVVNKLKVYQHDGTSESMMQIIRKSSPDLVCHLAGVSKYDHHISDIDNIIKSNILFGTHLVDAMIKNNVFNFINTGTYWQHYNDQSYNPTCLYAATKQSFVAILKYYIETYNLNVISLKLFDNFGPNDRRNKLFSFIDKSILEKKKIKISPGNQMIDILYISDLIEAYIVSINHLLGGNYTGFNEYFISSGKTISLKNLVSKYLEITKKEAIIEWGAREYRNREIMIPYSQGKSLPGWIPKVKLEDGLKNLK